MSHTGTLRTAQATSSTDEARGTVTIDLKAPTSWRELTQEQLRFVFQLVSMNEHPTVIKTCMLIKFCGLEVLGKTDKGWKVRTLVDGKKTEFFLREPEIWSLIKQFKYIDQLEDMDCRLDAVCGLHAADALLQKKEGHREVTFEEYLNAEKYYQMFIISKDITYMDNVAMWLYRDRNDRAAGYGDAVDDNGKKVEDVTLTPAERTGTMLWYNHVKRVMAKAFPHFFHKAATEDGELEAVDIMNLYNVQLRALTGGDATKEKDVLALDCWRALTELDAKAREAEELEKMRKKH